MAKVEARFFIENLALHSENFTNLCTGSFGCPITQELFEGGNVFVEFSIAIVASGDNFSTTKVPSDTTMPLDIISRLGSTQFTHLKNPWSRIMHVTARVPIPCRLVLSNRCFVNRRRHFTVS